jgi:hypothetical protein
MYEHYISVTHFEGTKGEKVIYKKCVSKRFSPGSYPLVKSNIIPETQNAYRTKPADNCLRHTELETFKSGFMLGVTPSCKWYINTLQLNRTCYVDMVIIIDLYV